MDFLLFKNFIIDEFLMERQNPRLLWGQVIKATTSLFKTGVGKERARITGRGIFLSQRIISKIRVAMLQFTRRTKLSVLRSVSAAECKVFPTTSTQLKREVCAVSGMLNRLLLQQK